MSEVVSDPMTSRLVLARARQSLYGAITLEVASSSAFLLALGATIKSGEANIAGALSLGCSLISLCVYSDCMTEGDKLERQIVEGLIYHSREF